MKHTRIRIIAVGIALIALGLSSCATVLEGSGAPQTIVYDHDNFSRFNIWGAASVNVRQEGTEYSVAITIDDNLQSYVICASNGGELSIGLDKAHSYRNFDFSAEITIPATVLPTAFVGKEASQSHLYFQNTGNMSITMYDAATFTVGPDWTGTGRLDIHMEDASKGSFGDGASNNGDVSLVLYDASDLDFGIGTSNGGNLDVTLRNASKLGMRYYEVIDANVSFQNASTARINVDEALTGTLSDASSLIYYGSPTSNTITLESGSSMGPGA